jgi:hypothetical protein
VFQVEPSQKSSGNGRAEAVDVSRARHSVDSETITSRSAWSLHEIPGIDTKSRGGIHGHYDIFCGLCHGTSEPRSSSKTVGTAWPLDREFRVTKIGFERARAHEKIAFMTPYVV